MISASAPVAWAEDVVWYTTAKEPSKETRRGGTILDYRGDGLQLRTLAGREVTIPAEDVTRIQYDKNEQHRSGDAAFARDEYQAAFDHYQKAMRGDKRSGQGAEKRGWVRAELTAASLRCRVAMGDYGTAGRLFVNLIRRDEASVHLHLIPLAWTSEASAGELKAKAWSRGSEHPAVLLLTASHLMRTPRRDVAIADLQRLAQSDDLDMARLASAQLWLTQVPTATDADLLRWRQTIDKLPEKLRGGPYYVLGRGYAARKRFQPAALTLMRVPILFPDQRDVAAEALLSAGAALSALGEPGEAARLFREVTSEYPKSYAAQEATGRLEKLQAAQE